MPPVYKSQIPAALVELYNALVAAMPAPVVVHDGQWIDGSTATQLVIVGWSGFVPGYQYPSHSLAEETGGAAVQSIATSEGLAPSIRETFKVSMAAVVRLGNNSPGQMQVARQAAYNNVLIVGKTVSPIWPGSAVIKSTMGATQNTHQVQDRRGLLVLVAFTIDCESYAQQ